MLDSKKDVRELVLFVHNMQQSLVLLNKSIKSNKKLLKKVIQARENTRRAGHELLDMEEKLFETRAEKLLFLKEINHITDSSASIAEIIKSKPLPSSVKRELEKITGQISNLSKEMDFYSILETGDIIKPINDLRNDLIDKELDPQSFFMVNKTLDHLKEIVYALEKANQF